MESVGTRVRQLRRAKRRPDGTPWTQEDLAEAAGIDRRYLGKIETEEISEPGIETLRRLAHALEVPLRRLAEPMGWYDDEPAGSSSWDQVRDGIRALDGLDDEEKDAILTIIERRLRLRRSG